MWGFAAAPYPRNVHLVLVEAIGDAAEDLDLLRGILALSPLLSVRVHIAPGGEVTTNWRTSLGGTGLRAFVAGWFVPYDVAIVIPEMSVPAAASTGSDGGSEELRRARDANLTASLRNQSLGQRGRMAVFGQPPAWQPGVYWESARDIAEVIADGALEANPLPGDDALAIFAAAAQYAKYIDDFDDGVPITSFWHDRVRNRMLDLASSVVKKYTDEAMLAIDRQTSGWWSDPEREATKVADKAMAEYRREFDAMPAQLRSMAGEESIECDLRSIERELNRLPIFARAADSKRRREFDMNRLARQAIALLGPNAA
jgi:hypothetical protein